MDILREIIRKRCVRFRRQTIAHRIAGGRRRSEVFLDLIRDFLFLECFRERADAFRLVFHHDLREECLHLRELFLERLDFLCVRFIHRCLVS